MRTISAGVIFALIRTICTEIILVDDIGLKNSQRGSKTLSDMAQRLRRRYGDNVNVVKGFPNKRYVSHGPHVGNYVPVSNMLRGFNPAAIQRPQPHAIATPQPVSKMPRQGVPAVNRPNPLPGKSPVPGYKQPPKPVLKPTYYSPPREPAGAPEKYLMESSGPNIPKPSAGPVYSPILNPEMSISKTPKSTASKSRSIPSKSKSSAPTDVRTTKSPSAELPKSDESSDYGVEMSTPEKELPEVEDTFSDKPKAQDSGELDPGSDDLGILLSLEEMQKQKAASSTKGKSTATRRADSSVKIDSPIKIDTSKGGKEEPTSEDILKAAKEISNILIPHMKKRGYAKKHNSNIQSAGKARQSYLDYKLIESQESQKNIEKRLDALRELYNKISAKLKSLRSERDLAKAKISGARSTLENNESTIKSLQEDIIRSEGQIKLEETEIMKLEKTLNEERNKFSILTEQQKIYQNRLESFGNKEGSKREELKSSENKLKNYDKLLEQIERDAENLQAKIAETEAKRRQEIDMQNRLEIEKKEIEDSNHLPLFALYD